MSILIKGMEMPKDIEPGLVIEFADGINRKRHARLYHYRYGGLTEWLEAISVPEHGRCIDADLLCEKLEKAMKIKPYLEGAFNAAISFAITAPTIIQTEE